MKRSDIVRATLGVAIWALIIYIAREWGVRSIVEVRGIAVGAAPLVGRWFWHPMAELWPAAILAVLVVGFGPPAVQRAGWRVALAGSGAVAALWTLLLAAGNGWSDVSAPLNTRYEYLAVLDRIGSPLDFLATYIDEAASYPTHVKGHPPGSALVFWALDQVGLRGPNWAAAFVLVCVAVTVVAVLVTAREVVDEAFARRAAPFVALAPAAVWAGFSPDPLYAAAIATGTALLAIGTRPQTHHLFPLAGGAVLGLALHLTYGAVPLLAIGATLIMWRRAWGALALACVGAAAVTGAFVAAGFWWFEGLSTTREFYYAGVASRRPYDYFVFAGNPAALAFAIGPAAAAGIATLRDRKAWLLVGAALAAVTVANVSGLSKGEVERIWIPFTPWLLLAPGALAIAGRAPRLWLAAQAALALWLQAALLSPW